MFETLADFSRCLATLPEPNTDWRERAYARQAALTKPPGSLGRIEDIAVFLAGWGHDASPSANAMRLAIFAGNHGVVAQGISPYPSEVTAQMVANFEAGGAASNAFTRTLDIGFNVYPLDLARPTNDITRAPAMDEVELLSALNAGARAIISDDDVVILGEMGIGNTTIAAALAARALGGTGRDWAGPGTGLDQTGVALKADVVDRALALHQSAPRRAIDTLRLVGGRETAALAGAILAARRHRIPVLLDGYVVCAALAPLFAENPKIVEHCLAGHVSAEPAHRQLLEAFGLQPYLDLKMRLGEGTGALLATALLRAACAAHNEMATFEEASVAGPGDTQS